MPTFKKPEDAMTMEERWKEEGEGLHVMENDDADPFLDDLGDDDGDDEDDGSSSDEDDSEDDNA